MIDGAMQSRSKALSHPLRFEILGILSRRTASPTDIAAELGAKLEDVAYHTKRLVDLQCAELVERQQKRPGGWSRTLYRAAITVSSSERAEAALDAIAHRLETAEGSPYAELRAVADIVAATGRRVTVAGMA